MFLATRSRFSCLPFCHVHSSRSSHWFAKVFLCSHFLSAVCCFPRFPAFSPCPVLALPLLHFELCSFHVFFCCACRLPLLRIPIAKFLPPSHLRDLGLRPNHVAPAFQFSDPHRKATCTFSPFPNSAAAAFAPTQLIIFRSPMFSSGVLKIEKIGTEKQ